MKNKKQILVLVILFMTIGIAAVTTNVIINGSTTITKNPSDYNVFFSKALVNGTENNSIITANNQITFNKEFQAIGDTYKIDYTITNDSRNYDANVSVSCTEGDTYLSISNSLETSTAISAKGTRVGTLEIRLIKSFTGDNYNKTITCTLNTDAVERTALAS